MDAGLLELQGTPGREHTVMGQELGHTKHHSAAGPSSPRILGLGFSESMSVKHISVPEVQLVGTHRRSNFTESQ